MEHGRYVRARFVDATTISGQAAQGGHDDENDWHGAPPVRIHSGPLDDRLGGRPWRCSVARNSTGVFAPCLASLRFGVKPLAR